MKEFTAILAFIIMTPLALIPIGLITSGDPTNPTPVAIIIAVIVALYSAWSSYKAMAKKEKKT